EPGGREPVPELASRVATQVMRDPVVVGVEELVRGNRQENETARLERTLTLAEDPDVVRNVLDGVEQRDQIERVRPHRQRMSRRDAESLRTPGAREAEHVHRDVESRDVAVPRQRPQHAAAPAPNLEDAKSPPSLEQPIE